MWPWEHLALGYLLYSGYLGLRHGRDPRGRDVLVLAVATQFPDLVDKPLAWTFGVLPSGTSLAHSALTATLLIVCVALAARGLGAGWVAPAFAIGYLSHLLGDVLFFLFTTGELVLGFLLWPIVPDTPAGTIGLLPTVQEFWAEFLVFLGTPTGRLYLVFELLFLATALLRWHLDGRPGLGGRVLSASGTSAD